MPWGVVVPRSPNTTAPAYAWACFAPLVPLTCFAPSGEGPCLKGHLGPSGRSEMEPEEPCPRCERRLTMRQALVDWGPVIAGFIDVMRSFWS